MPELTELEQRCVLGGVGNGDLGITGAYSYDEMIYMVDMKTWTGGYVDGMGYVEENSVTGHYYSGVYSEMEMLKLMTQDNWRGGWVDGEYFDGDCFMTGLYTFYEVVSMMHNGEWNGGWIDGSGYIGADITGFVGVHDYTYDDMLVMIGNGTWSGGVEGSGYVSSEFYVDVTGVLPVTGSYDSSYSFKEMEAMIDSGKWEGGFVDDLGYVGEVTYVTGCVGGGLKLLKVS